MADSPLHRDHAHERVLQAAATPPPPQLSTDAMLEIQKTMEIDALAQYHGLLLVLAVGYGIICLLSLALVVYMRRNRTVALRGDSSAARKIILPAYLPLLLLLTVLALVFSVYFWVLRFVSTQVAGDLENEIYFCGRLFFMLLVVVYMYQKSVTTPALKRATLLSFLLSFYTVPIVWLATTYCTDVTLAYWIPNCLRIALVVFFLWVLVMPPERSSKRAMREYVVFVLVYYVLFFVYSELFHQQLLDSGFAFAYANILWGSLCPLVIWRVLKADTEHWRGLGRRAVALQSLFRQKHRMNERISSRGLHVLIEMHRKFIIDFAYLELKRKIGTGSSAVVFNGMLHSKTPVAIKVYSPTELTDEVVAEFSHEAALCGALHHPNIVKFFGMCVCPPTICLVSELCQGSLDDVTKTIARRPHDVTRQQLMINLNYMIDATRAVAYLHSFSPAFIHRDIKPANFLVDRNCVVKLTDFGESRSLPREYNQQRGRSGVSSTVSVPDPMDHQDTSLLSRLSVDGWQGELQSHRPAMTVRGTAEYMAPEIIQGKAGTALYGEAADIFSLAMTLWDIVYPLEDKYPSANGNHLKVFESVLDGERPPLYSNVPLDLQELLATAWDPCPENRPSALAMLSVLEKIQQHVSCEVASVLLNAMAKKVQVSHKKRTSELKSAGQDLVQKMLEFDIVDSLDEALRAGNGLMSSGLLHHARHLVGFENSSELFAFDEKLLDAIQFPEQQLAGLSAIVEQQPHQQRHRSVSSSAQSDSDSRAPGGRSPERSDHSTPEMADFDDEDSVFGRSVGPGAVDEQPPPPFQRQTSKPDESRDVETASVASAIGSTVSELLRFGPLRKLSRGGGSTTSNATETPSDRDSPQQHQQRRPSTAAAAASRAAAMAMATTTHATSSQWASTTNTDSSVCPCRRLGAGMMYVTRRGGAGGGGRGGASRGINKRIRRARRAGDGTSTNGSFTQSGTNTFSILAGGSSTTTSARGPLAMTTAATMATTSRSTAGDLSLTAKLLMNDFSNTGDSEPYDLLSPPQTPLSDVEMGFHVVVAAADMSDDEIDDCGDGDDGDDDHEEILVDGSSVESATSVHPVDLA